MNPSPSFVTLSVAEALGRLPRKHKSLHAFLVAGCGSYGFHVDRKRIEDQIRSSDRLVLINGGAHHNLGVSNGGCWTYVQTAN